MSEGPSAAGEPIALVADGGRFEGLVDCAGRFRIEGAVHGDVVARGALAVGRNASIVGDVDTDELVLEGSLSGHGRARRRARLGPEAELRGELETPSLEIAEGARLAGRVKVAQSAD
jgi:cytoskeletal protein CcmA (bactofilin family)